MNSAEFQRKLDANQAERIALLKKRKARPSDEIMTEFLSSAKKKREGDDILTKMKQQPINVFFKKKKKEGETHNEDEDVRKRVVTQGTRVQGQEAPSTDACCKEFIICYH